MRKILIVVTDDISNIDNNNNGNEMRDGTVKGM